MHGLAGRKTDISNAVAYTNAAAGTVADLLTQARPPLQKVVHETDRAAGIVVADHDYFDNLLKTLPDAYQMLDRQGLYGDFFSFYLCDVVLKLNGKGGQPVYVKVAGQDSGQVHAAMKSFAERNPSSSALLASWLIAAVALAALNYDKLPFFNQGKELLGILRRSRRSAHRCAGAGFGLRVGEVDSIDLDGPQGAGQVQGRQQHPARRPDRGGDQDQEPAGQRRSWRSPRAATASCPGRSRSSGPRRPTSFPTRWAI